MVVTIAIVGAGQRGKGYARFAKENPHLAKVVSVAEPRQWHRDFIKSEHNLEPSACFEDWKALAATGKKVADAVVIATLDREHKAPALAFAALGYHILLEKPMAVDESDCREITAAVKAAGIVFAVGHVMRYSPLSTCLKEVLDSGAVGEIMSIQHLEPVGWYHAAHSYVRGNWRREDEASFMLMAKSCHDMDWLRWVMNRKCVRVSSFGSLVHFKKENQPKGAASRCVDCKVEAACPYSAVKIYRERALKGDYKWPVAVITPEQDIESVDKALREGPYGRCVYECDNDVVDSQVVNMEFEGGRTASFSMVAFTELVCERQTRIFGTRGELVADAETVSVFDFATKQKTVHHPYTDKRFAAPADTELTGHGGGDWHLMNAFVKACAANDPKAVLSGADMTLESHLITFAAERARKNGTVEQIKL